MKTISNVIVRQIAMEIVAYCQMRHGKTVECIDYVLDELDAHFTFNPKGRHNKEMIA